MLADNKSKYKRLNHMFIVIFKLIIVFLISLRLSLLPQDLFRDRINYLYSISNSSEVLFGLMEKGWFFLLHEPLMKLLNYLLSFYLESEFILSLYAFLNCFFVFTFILFNRKKISYSFLGLLFLLVTPYIFASTLGAIQQGLGFSIILIMLIRKENIASNRFACALFLASLFHVIFYVFLATLIFYRIVKRFNKSEVLSLFFVFGFMVLVGFLWGVVTPFLNSTQSYEDYKSTTSGVTFIGWFIVFLIFFINYLYLKKKGLNFYDSAYRLSLFFFLCFLVFYWLAPGPYRILYSAMPLIIYSLFMHINKYSIMCLIAILIYSFVLHSVDAGAGSLNVTYSDFISNIIYLK